MFIELVLLDYLACLIWFFSTVKLFSMSTMILIDLSVTFIPTEVLKHSTKSKPLDKFEHRSYTDKTLCITVCNF